MKGNPFDENENFFDPVIKYFNANINKMIWTVEPSFILWSNEYRTIKVYKIASLLCTEKNKYSVFESLANIILIERKILLSTPLNFQKKEIIDHLQGSIWVKRIAEFFGKDDDFIMNVMMNFFSPNNDSKMPLLIKQRIQNFTKILKIMIQTIIFNSEKIMKSNVLITAIDERNFSPYLFYNGFRRNDEAYCTFEFMNQIINNPNLEIIPGADKIKRCFSAISHLLNDEIINVEQLEKEINCEKTGLLDDKKVNGNDEKENSIETSDEENEKSANDSFEKVNANEEFEEANNENVSDDFKKANASKEFEVTNYNADKDNNEIGNTNEKEYEDKND